MLLITGATQSRRFDYRTAVTFFALSEKIFERFTQYVLRTARIRNIYNIVMITMMLREICSVMKRCFSEDVCNRY